MSESDRLSPEVLANLRAIRAGEPWPNLDVSVPRFTAFPPNDLVPDSTWRLTAYGAAVLALADERDALRQRVADNDAHEAAWAAGAQAACAHQPVQDCPYTDEALCKAWVSGYAHEGWIPGGVLAVEREAELQGKIEALRQRVAGFERLLTEPKVEQARLLTLRETVDGLGRHVRGEMTADSAQVDYWRQEILEAVIDTLPDVLDEAMVANLHRRLNKGVAGALGLLEMQKDPETGESYLPSWHDLPERVAALVQERDALKAEMADLLKPAVDIDLRGALANVRALRALLGIPAAERTTGERADIEALYANMTEAMGMVLSEIPRLRAALRLADEQSAEAIKRVSSEIVADKWNSTAEFQAEVERLRNDLRRVDHALQGRIKPGDTLERTIANLIADLDRASADVERLTTQVKDAETRADNAYAEGLSYGQTAAEGECDADHEAQPDPEKVAAIKAEMERVCAQFQETRLTLLAEQGKPEGAPPGWSYKPGDPDFDEPGEWVHKKLRLKVWKSGTGWVWGRKERSGVFVGPNGQEDDQPARVVMLAATAAVKSGGAR